MYVRATASYASTLNRSVTLTLMPETRASSIAGSASVVPGIVIIAFGRPSRFQSLLASAMVLTVSCARRGETPRLTYPSAPPVRS